MEERRKSERRNHLMNDEEVGQMAKVSVNTVRYWRQTGTLPFVRVGRCSRVWYSEFLKVFKNPQSRLALTADTMAGAGGIRRQL